MLVLLILFSKVIKNVNVFNLNVNRVITSPDIDEKPINGKQLILLSPSTV